MCPSFLLPTPTPTPSSSLGEQSPDIPASRHCLFFPGSRSQGPEGKNPEFIFSVLLQNRYRLLVPGSRHRQFPTPPQPIPLFHSPARVSLLFIQTWEVEVR